MAAKEKWLSGEVNLARQILSEAFTANSDSENIFLAAFKLEFENNELERARAILDKARASDSSSTQRVWMKSAIVERELGDALAEARVLEEGLSKFPYFDKLWLMLGQLEERKGKPDAARQVQCHPFLCLLSCLKPYSHHLNILLKHASQLLVINTVSFSTCLCC